MDLKLISEELAFIQSELKRLDEAFNEATQSQYFEKASAFRFEKHKNKLRLHELKYKCLVYLEECEFTCYRWKQLQEVRLFMQREFGY
jgi:hypothetical protein